MRVIVRDRWPSRSRTSSTRSLVERVATRLAAAGPGFDARAPSCALAGDGLEALELKARALQLCAALEATLPAGLRPAAAEPAGRGAWPADDGAGEGCGVLWPVGEFVARRGLDTPERALAALHALTQRFTAEFAIRPFIVAPPGARLRDARALGRATPSEQVRRLVSEGSRPRLPWGLRLAGAGAPTRRRRLPLLRRAAGRPERVSCAAASPTT
ncbi:MAG: hypothetical protein MZW92_73555 [Comamonadaceae bacterium]|nr:hypothetical protein [Comamonadaceae bacterium]